MSKIAAFIDGSNLYATSKVLNITVDFTRVLDWIAGGGDDLVRAFYYTAVNESEEYVGIRPLIDWLDYNGYTVVTKPTKEFTDASGVRKIKGNMDIEIAVDMMKMAEHVDHIILFSGDGDFRSAVAAVQAKGVRVTVVSSIKTKPAMVADEIRRQADHFVDLDQIRGDICKIENKLRAAE